MSVRRRTLPGKKVFQVERTTYAKALRCEYEVNVNMRCEVIRNTGHFLWWEYGWGSGMRWAWTSPSRGSWELDLHCIQQALNKSTQQGHEDHRKPDPLFPPSLRDTDAHMILRMGGSGVHVDLGPHPLHWRRGAPSVPLPLLLRKTHRIPVWEWCHYIAHLEFALIYKRKRNHSQSLALELLMIPQCQWCTPPPGCLCCGGPPVKPDLLCIPESLSLLPQRHHRP